MAENTEEKDTKQDSKGFLGMTEEQEKEFNKAMDKSSRSLIDEKIPWPAEVTSAKIQGLRYSPESRISRVKVGDAVSIRPVSPTDDKKTYLGFYMGEIPIDGHLFWDPEDKDLTVSVHTNPAIFVPDLNRMVFGMESWWGKIKSQDDLEKITDKSISDLWYVRALKALGEAREKETVND